MKVGDRVFLGGGYDMEPEWLNGTRGYSGVIERFIPGQSDSPAAVVHFDRAIDACGVTGNYAVLELRYVGATWNTSSETVHVELCNFVPDHARWQERRQGKWVESNATVCVVVEPSPASESDESRGRTA